jgi:hypothetical protein
MLIYIFLISQAGKFFVYWFRKPGTEERAKQNLEGPTKRLDSFGLLLKIHQDHLMIQHQNIVKLFKPSKI